jgi:DNA-binding MarR family transcriptional regulator
MTDKTDSVDYAALANFRFALRTFLDFSESRAAEHGLTPQQHQALLAIRGAGDAPVTVGFIAERLIIKPHTASGLIDRLVTQGLASRQSSTSDRRHTFIRLTPAAERLLGQLSATHREELRRLRPTFTELLRQLG